MRPASFKAFSKASSDFCNERQNPLEAGINGNSGISSVESPPTAENDSGPENTQSNAWESQTYVVINLGIEILRWR